MKSVRGESWLGEELAESWEHWYIAKEGEVDVNCDFGNVGVLMADGEAGNSSCVVGGY